MKALSETETATIAIAGMLYTPIVVLISTLFLKEILTPFEMVGGLWVADMSLSGGPKLPGCRRRADALAAERGWLREHGY